MKRLALGLIVFASLLLLVSLKSRPFRHREQAPSGSIRQQILASPLTQLEESDLQTLLPLALTSIKERVQPLNCLEGEKLIQVNFAEGIKKHEGREIELTADIRENTLIVYLDVMHTYLVFPRLHELGLAPAEYDVFCHKTREDYVAAQKQYPFWQEAKKNVRDDPEMTAIVDRINEKYPSADYDKITREEVRKYQVPVLSAKAVEPYVAWSEEKKRLYGRILELIKREACLSLSYSPNYPVRVTVPDFNIGDPEIDLLLKGRSAQSSSIEWIKFSRDVSSGEYTVEPAKNLGLADEVMPLIPLIKRKRVRQVTVECP